MEITMEETLLPPSSSQIKNKESKSKESLKSEKKCNVCGASADKSCSACKLVKYCSIQHQRDDWPNHKNNCCPYILKSNEAFGRHLVAARNLQAGTLIIEEDPILSAPRGLVDEIETPICLSCCVLMEDEKSSYRCSKCNWPTCCWNCEQHKLHAQNECKIFSEKKISYPPRDCEYPVYVLYKVIEILRGVLLKERNPEIWSKIMNLQYITELGNKADLFQDLSKLRKTFGVQDIGLDEDWTRLLGVLNVNNFSMEGRRGSDAGPSFTGYLFLQSSILSHSCAPNCWWGVTMFPNMKINVRTTVDVDKGQILTVPYSFLYNAFGTHKRQELIQSDGEFVCKCLRCVSPTELESFTSALICEQCKNDHIILPLNPIVLESEWKCTNCNMIYSCDHVNDIIEKLMTELEECDTVMKMENFVKENQGIIVHSNHWLITEAEDVMCQHRTLFLDEEEDEITLEDRNANIELCEHLVKVKNIIAPGYSLERGRLLNRLARARLERLDTMVKNKTLTDIEEISAEAEFIYLLYDEALNFYKHDITEISSHEKYGLKCRMIMSDMQLVKERFQVDVEDAANSSSSE